MLLPPITRALMRRPAPTIAAGLTSQELGAPDFALTLQNYHAYLDALSACQLEITLLPADERYPDGHYVEDTAILFRDLAFICRPGAPERAGEPDAIAHALSHLHVVHIDDDSAFIDGGDVLFCHDRVLIGLSARTNRAGAEQLRHALQSVQSDIRVDFVPLHNVLHLKSSLTELAPGVLLYGQPMEIDFKLEGEVVNLPPEEGYAANVLPINDTLLIAAGYPTVRALAEKHYTKIIEIQMREFEKMDGALTCLSLRY